MAIDVFKKAPGAVEDYTVDWVDFLNTGVTISTSTWAADSGITIDSDSKSTTATTVILSSGTHGKSYIITNTVTLSDSVVSKRAIKITVVRSEFF